MTKFRATLGILGMLCAMGVAAAPAMAIFEGEKADNGTASAGQTLLSIPGASTVCSKAEGAWVIWSKGTTKVNSEQIQAQQTKGPHQLISVSKWNNCVAITGAGREPLTVKPCKFQLVQETPGSLAATASVSAECVITTEAGCIIKIPQESKINENLTKIALKNNGTNLEANAEIGGGITATVNAICKAAGLSNTSEGTFKALVTENNAREV